MRLDQALVERGLCETRSRAKTAICAGLVAVNAAQERKPGREIAQRDEIALNDDGSLRYVGRGALKLAHALDAFGITVEGLHCLDAGASTGGFTQVLLERGARSVVAVDVGAGQLARVLRDDPRVLCMERTDIRSLEIPPVDFACVDVSFISLKLILPKLYALLKEEQAAVCLLKPQFEAGPGAVGKHGLVKDPKVHRRVIEEVSAAAQAQGFRCCGLERSPITGGGGNIEFLLYLRKGGAP